MNKRSWSRDVLPGHPGRSYRHFLALLTEGGVNHTPGTDQYVLASSVDTVDTGGKAAIR